MPKINQEEYEVLKSLDDYWKWIARDEDSKKSTFPNELWLYEYKPQRSRIHWLGEGGATKRFGYDNLFQFIKHKDSEPYSIDELIEEYEYSTEHVAHIANEKMKLLGKAWGELFKSSYESEETEVKTLESIREEIWEEMLRLEDKRKDQWADIKYQTLREVLQKLGHLDEPEVLSQEWIDENSQTYQWHESMVPVSKLQNLLVPKQIKPKELYKAITGISPSIEEVCDSSGTETFIDESVSVERIVEAVMKAVGPSEPEKPVIPQFVADYIEEGKDLGSDLGTAMTVQTEVLKDIRDYIKNNEELFARAWLYGYTIKKEDKYYAKVKGWGVNGNDGHAYYSGKFPLSLTMSTESVAHTKDEWKNYGVYEDNADFVKVEELEE